MPRVNVTYAKPRLFRQPFLNAGVEIILGSGNKNI